MHARLLSPFVAPVLMLGLAGCDPALLALGGATPSAPVPESVRALAAPWQNVDSARVLPEDGCWWYEHQGPVETTLLPLRTPQGRPICTQATDAAPAEGTDA